MLEFIRKRLIDVGRNEDGAALVITMAVFMFMYLMIIGVYAVGTNVKNKILIQNACDSAAYSAAVVQADTLSRIATLNRAMSWTYVQMTRRQMDYIADRWLQHSVGHYNHDKTSAMAWWLIGTLCPMHSGWGISSTISLNGTKSVAPSAINTVRNGFQPHLASNAGSFYSGSPTVKGLESQISDDKVTIASINSAIADLASELPQRQDQIVREILKANLPSEIMDNSKILVKRSENPLSGESNDGYLEELHNNANDESRFLWFGGYWGNAGYVRRTNSGTGWIVGADGDQFFKNGASVWFKRGNQLMDTPMSRGIQRSYRMLAKGPTDRLFATWTWWATKSVCIPPTGETPWVHVPPGIPLTTCAHPVTSPLCVADDRCQAERTEVTGKIKVTMRSRVHGNIFALWNDRYVGEDCHPLVLGKEYFEKNGTITVGIACKNENPWFWIGDVKQGVFSAFEPFVKWTVCFSSAKAGYKRIGEDVAARNYKVDWKVGVWGSPDQSWNLCQSDWDAVLIPVRRAESSAVNSSWGASADFLSDYVNELSSLAADARAGENWQIGIPGGRVDWDKLQERIFH